MKKSKLQRRIAIIIKRKCDSLSPKTRRILVISMSAVYLSVALWMSFQLLVLFRPSAEINNFNKLQEQQIRTDSIFIDKVPSDTVKTEISNQIIYDTKHR